MNRPTALSLTFSPFSVLGLGPFLLAMVLLAVPLAAAGSVFVVDSTADEIDANPGDSVCASISGSCTLRAAIMETNVLPGADAITLPAGVYTLAIPGTLENAAATGDLDLIDDLEIIGAGKDQTTIDANGIDRVLDLVGTQYSPVPTFVVAGVRVTGGIEGNNFNELGAGLRGAPNSLELELREIAISGNAGVGLFLSGGGCDGAPVARLSDCEISENAGGGLFWGAYVSLDRCSVSQNTASSHSSAGGFDVSACGVIYGSLELSSTTVTGNSGGVGGISVSSADLLIHESTITENSGGGTGGLSIWGDGYQARYEIDGSTISGNIGGQVGGGLYVDSATRVLLINSTISGNEAPKGGGIFQETASVVRLVGVTVSDNTAHVGGGGLGMRDDFATELKASILAGNEAPSGPDCLLENLGYSVTSLGGNVIGDDSNCQISSAPTDSIGTSGAPIDPLLGGLADNGGSTHTHALLPGSPAIDAIPRADCTWDDDGDPGTPEVPLTEDQRGISRPRGAGCDIGAFERAPSTGPTCGIGPELVLLTPLLMLAHGRRRRWESR